MRRKRTILMCPTVTARATLSCGGVLVKYIIETKRLFKGWSQGAVWLVPSGCFRAFLEYINGCDNHFGATMRIRRVRGDLLASYFWPEDGSLD